MFGKRVAVAHSPQPAPAPAAAEEPAHAPEAAPVPEERPAETAGAVAPHPARRRPDAPKPRPGPRPTAGLDQLRAAQNGGPGAAQSRSGAVAEIVREQSDYYHATKTTIYTALLNTIDLSQLAQLDQKAAAEEIRDIVAELVAIKNVS